MTEQVLDRVLDRAIAWITERLSYFSIHRAQAERARLEGVKRLGELALAGSLLAGRRPETAQLWQETAWELLDRGAVLRARLLQQPTLAVLCAAFAAGGRRDPEIDRILASAQWRAEAQRAPRVFRFALDFAVEAMGIEPPEPWQQYYVEEPLARHVPPEQLTDVDGYAIVHAAGWLTDFGRLGTGQLGADDLAYLRDVAPRLVERAIALGNTDLLAESVLAVHCAGAAAAPAAWQALAAAQDGSGVVVRGLTRDPGAWLRGRSEGEIFLAHLHPTLATIMAAATAKGDAVPV